MSDAGREPASPVASSHEQDGNIRYDLFDDQDAPDHIICRRYGER